MALEQFLKTLVRKPGQAASKAQPFYSPVDQAIANITQNKGTGAQMLAEILKTKGAAKELKDRPAVKKALEQPKITKQELERVAADNPAPQIEETVLGGRQKISDKQVEDEYRRIYGEPYTSDGERLSIDEMRDMVTSETAGAGSQLAPKFAQYTIPGGENYREVLIRMPEGFNKSPEKAEFDELNKRMMEDGLFPEETARWEELGRKLGAEGRNANPVYRSSHFDEPNILAHARVSDRVGPNGEKILHIEEIQSDWHQAGRKKGYKTEKKEELPNGTKIFAPGSPDSPELVRAFTVQIPRSVYGRRLFYGRTEDEAIENARSFISQPSASPVPDAPFKQNWHELVMKRLLDDAARNGYDKVVLTPGAEQAKRYDLSKHVGYLSYKPEEGRLIAFDQNRRPVMNKTGISSENLEDYIGKDVAKRLLEAPKAGDYHLLEGEDLQIGGEGMKGFYDQILPTYLNEYGKKYGARVGTYDMPVGEKMVSDNAGLVMIRSGEQEIVPFHSFDITPQMREDIVGRGVPLYQVAPVGIGAAAAQQEESPEPMRRGGKVRVGMDAMRMAVMRKADGGSVWPEQMAARIFVNQKRVAGAPEPASVWQQQLQQGYTPHAETMSPEQANMSIQELLRAPTAPGMAAGGIVSAAQKAARAFVEARKAKGMPEYHEAWQKALQRGEAPPAPPASQEELTEEAKRLLETPKYKEMAKGGAIGSTSNWKKKKKINIDAMRMAVADKKLKGKKHG